MLNNSSLLMLHVKRHDDALRSSCWKYVRNFDLRFTHFFYKQLNFPSEPGVANEILENEAKSCLAVA